LFRGRLVCHPQVFVFEGCNDRIYNELWILRIEQQAIFFRRDQFADKSQIACNEGTATGDILKNIERTSINFPVSLFNEAVEQ
jgi:hypothetical protein